MLFDDGLFIGIDIAGGARRISYAALDRELRPAALGQGNMQEALAFIGGQNEAVIAINGPAGPNQGLLEMEEVLAELPAAPKGKWRDSRLAEYLLFLRKLPVQPTPGEETKCKGWMRDGFKLRKRLRELGFVDYPSEDAKKQVLEAWPQIAFAVWLERLPLASKEIMGRLQRQLALYDLGLEISDPMSFFEEVTRYRILQGSLPERNLYKFGELNALALAYTARAAVRDGGKVQLVGDKSEGQIVIPAAELRSGYK
jgi:hypothetical protein